MSLIKRWLGYLVLLLMLVFGVFFSFQNTAKVPLDLLVFTLPELSVALWIILAFACGGLLGLLTSGLLLVRLRSQLAVAQHRLQKKQQTPGQSLPAEHLAIAKQET